MVKAHLEWQKVHAALTLVFILQPLDAKGKTFSSPASRYSSYSVSLDSLDIWGEYAPQGSSLELRLGGIRKVFPPYSHSDPVSLL